MHWVPKATIKLLKKDFLRSNDQKPLSRSFCPSKNDDNLKVLFQLTKEWIFFEKWIKGTFYQFVKKCFSVSMHYQKSGHIG